MIVSFYTKKGKVFIPISIEHKDIVENKVASNKFFPTPRIGFNAIRQISNGKTNNVRRYESNKNIDSRKNTS